MGIKFSRIKPKIPGEYLYKFHNNFPTVLGKLAKGRWEKAQNPKLWYFNTTTSSEPIQSMSGYLSEIIPERIIND